MKAGAAFWVFIAVLVVAHLFLRLSLGLGARTPDLLTVAVLLGARPLPGGGAAALGFGLGLLEDAVSIAAFGATAASLTVVAYLGARTRDVFMGDSILFLAVYLFLGKWAHDAVFYALAGTLRRAEPAEALLTQAPFHALYATAVGLVLVGVFRMIRR